MLQDKVPAFGSEKAMRIIEEELGMPISRAYRSFEMDPIAAASLGQVQASSLSLPHLHAAAVYLQCHFFQWPLCFVLICYLYVCNVFRRRSSLDICARAVQQCFF